MPTTVTGAEIAEASLRVVMTYHRSLATPGGGSEVVLQNARHLVRCGCDVTLMPVSRDADSPAPEIGCRIIPIEPSRVHYLLDGRNVRRALDELLHRERIDAVISRATEGAYLPQFLRSAGVTFAMFGGVPSYATWVRRHKPWSPKRLTDRWFFLDPLRAADIVLADSCFTRRELTEIVGCDPRRVEVTYLGVEEQFLMLPREPADVVNRFFYCGSLAPYKGASDAIAALGRLAQQGRRDWTLRIAGWGDWETVKRGAREAGIASQVEMLGFLDREQQLKHLAWAHVAVLPSHSESFGLAVAEAQAAGLPVVAYAAGAIPEVVQDGVTAVLAPTGDTARLAEALSRLMDEPHTARRMGAAARDRVASTFTWTRTAQLVRRAIESRRVPRLAPAGQRVADTPPRG